MSKLIFIFLAWQLSSASAQAAHRHEFGLSFVGNSLYGEPRNTDEGFGAGISYKNTGSRGNGLLCEFSLNRAMENSDHGNTFSSWHFTPAIILDGAYRFSLPHSFELALGLGVAKVKTNPRVIAYTPEHYPIYTRADVKQNVGSAFFSLERKLNKRFSILFRTRLFVTSFKEVENSYPDLRDEKSIGMISAGFRMRLGAK